MASQRIVLASPWKLGLFVFLLVVGTGFGLVYAYLELLGGELDLSDEETVKTLYMVLGGVAAMGLLGYIACVTAARPLDRVVRGSRRREQLLKRLGRVEDPRTIDFDEFDGEPGVLAVLERWARDAGAASDARLAIEHQRQALSTLAEQVQVADGQGVSLDPEQSSPDLDPLVEAINRYVRETAQAVQERNASQPAPSGPAAPATGSSPALREAMEELEERHGEMRGLVDSIARFGAQLVQRPGRGGRRWDDAVNVATRSVDRLQELRIELEELAEESNKLAIGAALQISRLGDTGNELLPIAEELRRLSTRYQRLAGDLRMCESDQATIADHVRHGDGSVEPASEDESSMVFDQSTEALREVLERMAGPLSALRAATSVGAPASGPRVPSRPASDARAHSGPAPVTPAFAAPEALTAQAPLSGPTEPPMEPEDAVPAPAAEMLVAEPPAPEMTAGPREAAGSPQTEADDGDRIYDMDELGGREIARAEAENPIYELAQFGAVEL